ncbi:MAG: CHAD domain-containing protein [Gemmatimonadaceae bacterium]
MRTVALELLKDADAGRERLLTDRDEEALHDFRVAVRRLRSWLRAHRDVIGRSAGKKVDRALRRVAQETNESRDAEVFRGWLEQTVPSLEPDHRPGASWLSGVLASERPNHDAILSEETRTEFARAAERLEQRLPIYTVTHHLTEGPRDLAFAPALAASIRSHAVKLRSRVDRVRDATDEALVHRARIAGKRLRYLLEPVAPHLTAGPELIQSLKDLQDALGDVHDGHVWIEDVRRRTPRHESGDGRSGRHTDGEGVPGEPDIRPGLAALVSALEQRVQERYSVFTTEWRGAAASAFFEKLERLASALEEQTLGDVEIERKYLLFALPERMPEGEVQSLDQGYLPGQRLVERVRRVRSVKGERHFRTVKSGEGVSRLELEEETSREVFDAMWPLTLGRRVTKRRHKVSDGSLRWEIDEFTDRDLVLAEVELRHEDQPVVIPEWMSAVLVREVTGEPEYVNANLAR